MIGPPPESATYLSVAMDEAKAAARARGIDLIDFGIGDPQDETPAFIREALAAAITPASSYYKAAGLEELRTAITEWVSRRFGATLDPATQVLPTLGSKEIIHSLPAYVLTPDRPLIAVPSPAYPVYERGARFHGADVVDLPLLSNNGFLPDLDAVSAATWQRTAMLWLNYPNNPTGAVAPMEYLASAAELAQRHGFLVAYDEAYSEIWFDAPPASGLQLEDLTNVVVINTLSKRSCMTGYRSGFIAGDHRVIAGLRNYRASVGVTPQVFVQRASVTAWSDEQHVADLRELWATKRTLLAAAFDELGLRVHGDATFYLWIEAPTGMTSAQLAERLTSVGIVTSPGHLFGRHGDGYVRLALVPPLDACRDAVDRLSSLSLDSPETDHQ